MAHVKNVTWEFTALRLLSFNAHGFEVDPEVAD
jgi:hypothetical protein